MPSFLTQCPHCLTSFRVTDAQLDAAEGLVRCGACLGIFSAASNRITLKQTAEDAAAAAALPEIHEADFDEEGLGEDVIDDEYLDEEDLDEEDLDEEDLDEEDLDEEDLDEELPHELDPGGQESTAHQVADLCTDIELAPVNPESLGAEGDANLQDFAPLPLAATGALPQTPLDASVNAALNADIGADEDACEDADLLDPEEFDVPLGDLNLEGDELDEDAAEFVDEDDDGEDDATGNGEADEYDEDDIEAAGIDDDAGYEDEDDEDLVDEADEVEELYEEYVEDEPSAPVVAQEEEEDAQAEEFEPEIQFDDEDFLDATDDSLAEVEDEEEDEDEDEADHADEGEDDEEYAAPPPEPVLRAGQRIGADKRELRRYLAEIEDDDALGVIDDQDALAAIDEPVMLHTAPRRSPLVGLALFAANLLLVGLLLLQVADAHLEALNRDVRLARLMPFVCRVLECPPPERSQLESFVSEQILVRSHPRFAQALEVNLVFRNDATVAQPFPALELSFSGADNALLANRLFAPTEYLPPELRTSEMPAQSSLQVALELADPGSDAVNYTLAFRKPQ